MKKSCFFILSLLTAHQLFATNHEVQASNFQFTPATVNALVGDTITWVWVNGTHTTTSLSVPAGAASWDKPMTRADSIFSYTLTVAGTYNYDCTIHAPTMAGTIVVSSVLPVVLSSFTITPTKVNTAFLQWVTATETNTDHFDVMRSTDGNHFEKIASVPAVGNSSVVTGYSYTDNSLSPNYQFAYYSLKIVDKDGRSALSDIKIFRNDKSTSKLIVSLSPNPINRQEHLMIQFNSDKEASMHVELYDASGKLVTSTDMAAVTGLNYGHFHMGNVAPGTYSIVFTMNGMRESYKVVVQ
jgi:plastocyanin